MSITLNTKVYNWGQFDPSGTGRYFNSGTGVPSSFSNLTAKVTYGQGGKSSRVKWRLVLPVVATEASACACPSDVLRTHYVDVTYDSPSTSSTAERTDVRLRLKDLIASPEFISSWDNLVQPSA